MTCAKLEYNILMQNEDKWIIEVLENSKNYRFEDRKAGCVLSLFYVYVFKNSMENQ